jgi:hypothetical protein
MHDRSVSPASVTFARLLPAVLLSAAAAHAQSITVQPRVSTGIQDYSLEFPSVTQGNPNGGFRFRDAFKVSDHLHFVGAGLTLGYQKLFIDVSGQRSSTGHDQGEQFQGTDTGSGFTNAANFGLEHNLNSAFSRKEFNATVGWGFTPAFSTYLGYKHAQADIASQIQPVLTPGVVQPGDVLFLGTRDIAFSYNGFFVGATYSVPVEAAHGAFAVQSSVARLNGHYTETFDGAVVVVISRPPFGQSIDPSFANKPPVYGKSSGLNLGASWTGNLEWVSERLRRLSYTIGIDRSEYKFTSTQTIFSNFEETSTRVRLDLRYLFSISTK